MRNLCQKCQGDGAERTVRDLMLEEMSTGEHQNNQTAATIEKHTSSDRELVYNCAKYKENKTSRQAYQIPSHHLKDVVGLRYNLPSSSADISNSSSIVGLMETIRDQIHCTKPNEINGQIVQRSAKEFIDQIYIGRKRNSKGVRSETKHFSDPLDILISNRSLFLQSLQFALRDRETIKLVPDAKCGTVSTGDADSVRNNKESKDNPSGNKVKDQYTYSSSRITSSQPLNKIVILRPTQKVMESPKYVTCSCSSLQSHQRPKNKGQKVKSAYVFFKEIKRILKRAWGDNQEKPQWVSTVGSLYKFSTKKQLTVGADDQQIKSRDKIDDKRDFKSRNIPEISSTDERTHRKSKFPRRSYSKNHEPEIFQEARKHLSERLRNMNRSEIVENPQPPRTLRKILFSPEHDLFSPYSSTRDMNPGGLNKISINADQNGDGDSKILETNDIQKPEDLSTLEVSFESNSEKLREEYSSNCSILASPPRDQIARSSSSSLGLCSPAELDSVQIGEEHQSPVSVLEPIFMEDAAKGSLRPLRIDFEFLLNSKLDIAACINKEESISAYVKAVLQASGLRNEPLLTRPSPKRVLGENLFSTELNDDPELLFDCVNEVLIEVYEKHFGCSPWTSYLKPNIRSFQLSENHLVDEVVKGVKGLVYPELAQPALDELVGQDFAKSASWLDIRFDTEDLVNEITDDFLQKILVDTILTLHS